MNNIQTRISQLTNRITTLERKVNDCCGSKAVATRSSEWTSALPPSEEELVNDTASVEEMGQMEKIPINDATLINKDGVNRSLITFDDPSISKIEKKSSSSKKKKKKKKKSSSKKKGGAGQFAAKRKSKRRTKRRTKRN